MSLLANEQLIAAYENLGMAPEDIAQAFGESGQPLEVSAVKAVLMQGSWKYRAASKQQKKLDFTDDELQEANEAILRLLRNSDDEHLVGRLARYIRDDKKGRLDVGPNLAGLQMNAIVFNQYIQDAQKAIEASKNGEQPTILIDVSAEKSSS